MMMRRRTLLATLVLVATLGVTSRMALPYDP